MLKVIKNISMNQEHQYGANWKDVFWDSSTIILISTNLITIVLAITQQWNMATIIWTYWIQSIIIGFFNVARIFSLEKFSTEGMTSNGKPVEPNSKKSKIDNGFFFMLHYGGFHFVYAVFLWVNFDNITWAYLGIGGIIFFCNHLFSFMHNRYQDRNKIPNIGHLMFSPYVRIIPMHLIIIFFGSHIRSTAALIVFLLLKSMIDLCMHLLEHKQKSVKNQPIDTRA